MAVQNIEGPIKSFLTKEQWAWSLFDAGCWGYASVTVSTIIPLVFKQDTPAADQGYSSAVWANTVAAGTLVAGLLCPFIGALVDVYSIRKATVFVTGTIMALLLTLFAFLDPSQWVLLVIVAALGVMSYSVMQAVYNSLLMHVSDSSEQDLVNVSAIQCAIGNGGAMVLMSALGLDHVKNAKHTVPIELVHTSFVVSAVWFLVLSIPFFVIYSEERPQTPVRQRSVDANIRLAWNSFRNTLQHRELVKYIIATLLYSDASATVFSIYNVFAEEIGVGTDVLLRGSVVNRWLGLFMGFVWIGFAKVAGGRMCLLVSIFAILCSCVMLALIHTDFDYWVVNVMLAISGSGQYVFSRVLLGRLTTRANTAQHFGLMAGVSRVSGIIGPVVYGGLQLVGGGGGSGGRLGILGLGVMGMAGLVLMARVNFDEGAEAATREPIGQDEEDGEGYE